MRIWVASIFTFFIFIYHFCPYFITLLSYRLNSLAVCVTSWICGPQLPNRVRNSCSRVDRRVLLNCFYRVFKSPSGEKNAIIFRVMLRCFLSRGYDPSDQPFGFFSFFFLFIFIFIFFYILYLHMYLHYTYFLHDAYTTLTCTTYNTYVTIQLHQSNWITVDLFTLLFAC